MSAATGLAVALLTGPIFGWWAQGSVLASAGPEVDRTITDSRIGESSGLIASLLHPGVLWTHNDSGNPPLIYAIGPDGRTRATLRLGAEPDVDWEAIAGFRGQPNSIAPGQALIAIGDIGDNDASHPSVRVAIVREPDRLRSASVSPIRVLRLRYPGGPRDAETLLSQPRTGQLYIVSKTLFGSTLYSVPLRLWPGGGGGTSALTTLTRVAQMNASFITDGAFLPDGRILLRGYGEMFVIDRPAAVHDGRLDVLASAMLPSQDQGESIAVIDGGRQALIGSEGHREPVLRVAVPQVAGDESPTSVPAGTTGQPSGRGAIASTSTQAGAAAPGFTGGGPVRIWAGLISAALALAAATSIAIVLWTRRRF